MNCRWTRSRGRSTTGAGNRRADRRPAYHAAQPLALHQARHRAPRDGECLPAAAASTLSSRRTRADSCVHTRGSRAAARHRAASARRPALGSALGPWRRSRSTERSPDCADRLDSVRVTMRVNERHHHVPRRSSSAWAKYADALRKISLVRRNSRFSRSSVVRRARSSVVRPTRWPVFRSACRTQRRSVSGVQPNLPAIDVIAAHCDPCSLVCSRTRRTERSCTSGEYRDVRGMTPSSHRMEPPAIPG